MGIHYDYKSKRGERAMLKWMQINLKQEQRKKRIERSLKNNLKKRKIFQNKIKTNITNNK